MRVLIILLLVAATGCKPQTLPKATKVLDAGQGDNLGGTTADPTDVRTMAERMAREILSIDWPKAGLLPRVALSPLDNQTRFRIDPKLLQNKLVKDLIAFSKGRVAFWAQNSEKSRIVGTDYCLNGEMRSLSKASKEGVSDYIVYSFQLVDAETGVILWMGDYEAKKLGKTGTGRLSDGA
ncbi:MAG: hypothetical protein I8H75_04370 [Myxococcaceae bacterium]|nr:hypothetical protein [Myxococcaceae bacterium]MBH2006558.1 hypothetical protein [Myxococcaceae bacterium]